MTTHHATHTMDAGKENLIKFTDENIEGYGIHMLTASSHSSINKNNTSINFNRNQLKTIVKGRN